MEIFGHQQKMTRWAGALTRQACATLSAERTRRQGISSGPGFPKAKPTLRVTVKGSNKD